MKYLASCLAALLAGSAWAHNTLPSAHWCQYERTTVVASFAFTNAQINAYILCVEQGLCPDPRPPNQNPNTATCDNVKSCGNFDDDYGKTALMINAHCEQYANAPFAGRGVPVPGHEIGSVVPIAYGPQPFLSPSHHADYSKLQGVQGVCAKCMPALPELDNPGN